MIDNYHNCYQYGGVVFAKLDDGAIFKEQALYGRLLDDLCIKIMIGELKKGDFLPTTKHLCAMYGISTTTVNRVYGILAETGFISRHVRSGTKLIAGPDDPEIWETLGRIAEAYKRNWENAIDVLFIMNSMLSRRIVITNFRRNRTVKNIKIGIKLFVIFGIILGMMLAMIVVAVGGLQFGNNHFREFYEYSYPMSNRTIDVRRGLQMSIKALGLSMLTDDPTMVQGNA